MLVLLVQAEGRVAGMGPTGIIGPIGLGVPGFEIASLGALKGTGAVVRTEEDHGIVQDVLLFQIIHLDRVPESAAVNTAVELAKTTVADT